MSCARLPSLLVLLITAAGSWKYGYAAEVTAGTAQQLRAALSDATVDTVVLPEEVMLDPGVFVPISVGRTVLLTSNTAAGGLSFSNTRDILITVAAGGSLTLQRLTVRDFYPVEPLQVTPESSILPISGISISSTSAALVIDSCVFLVQGQLAKVTEVMPFWSAQMSGVTQSVRTAADRQKPLVVPVDTELEYYGGHSSSVTVRQSVFAHDPRSCYTGQGAVTWDSSSLWSAIQDPNIGNALVFVNITLDPQQFSPLNSYQINSTMTFSGCNTTLDFNQLRGALVLQQQATLKLQEGLQLLGAADLDASSNSSGSLLLGSIDISQGAKLVLQDVSVGVPDSSSVLQALQQATQGNSSTAASIQQLPIVSGQQGPVFVVDSWISDLSGLVLPGIDPSAAAAGTTVVLKNVTVFQAADRCYPAGSHAAVAADDMRLQGLLVDSDASLIEITRDITLQASHWQGGNTGEPFEINRPVEIRGCHPQAASGARYVLDFSQLQGAPLLNLHTMLRWSGDLILKGLPDRAGAPGSWLLMPMVALAGDQAALIFEDVSLSGRSASPLHAADSSAWQTAGGAAGTTRSWIKVNNSMVVLKEVKLPVAAAAKLFPAMFVNNSNSSSSRRMLATSSPSSTSSSYYGFISTDLSWDPWLPAAAAGQGHQGVNVAALVLGLLFGIVVLTAVLWGLVAYVRRRCSHQQQQDGKCGTDLEEQRMATTGACCWMQPRSRDLQWQQLPDNGVAGQRRLQYATADHQYASGTFDLQDNTTDTTTLMSSMGGFEASGMIGRIGSADDSRQGQAYPGRLSLGQSLPMGQHAQQAGLYHLHQRDVEAGFATQYEKKFSGGLEGGLNGSRAAVLGANNAGGITNDANTTMTEEGTGPGGGAGYVGPGGQHKQHKQQVFEDARKRLGATAGDLARSDALVLESVLGEGTFGKVFKGYWKGTLVAVKTMMFPAAMSGKEKREKMAIMETAISASLSHPNIVQMYTYYLRPVLVGHEATLSGPANNGEGHRLDSSSVGDSTMNAAFLNEGLGDSVHSWEVQLVLEYCDQGSLRSLLNKKGAFTLPDGGKDMLLIVDTALDVARAMLHLHSEHIIHSDLKARNILLKSSGGADGRPFVAKVADFGLSMRIDPAATHVSNVYQGTMTHMAPEVMLQGKLSRGSDVYAFGILLWELYSSGHAFKGIPRALLGHEVAHQQRRPQFPEGSPFEYQLLACRCWESDVSIRPSFSEIMLELQRIKERLTAAGRSATVKNGDSTSSTVVPSKQSAANSRPPQQGAAAAAGVVDLQLQQQQPQSPVSPGSGAAAVDSHQQTPDTQQQIVGQQQQQQQKRLQKQSTDTAQPLSPALHSSRVSVASTPKTGPGYEQQLELVDLQLRQQQQEHEQRNKQPDAVPEHLSRQTSLTAATGDSIAPTGAAVTARTSSRKSAAASGAVGSPINGSSAHQNSSSAHQNSSGNGGKSHASVSGVEKSIYINDPYGSTTEDGPRCMLYGAGMNVRRAGVFWDESDSTGGDSDEVTAAPALAAAAAQTGVPATGQPAVQLPSGVAVTERQDSDPKHMIAAAAAAAVGSAEATAVSPGRAAEDTTEAPVGQQEQQHMQLSQRQLRKQRKQQLKQQQQSSAAVGSVKRLTSAAAAAAKRLLRTASGPPVHSSTATPTVVADRDVRPKSLDLAAARPQQQQQEQQQSPIAAADTPAATSAVNHAVPAAAAAGTVHTVAESRRSIVAAPSSQRSSLEQRSSMEAAAGRRSSSSYSGRRSAEASSSRKSVEMAVRPSDHSQQQHLHQQQQEQLPVIGKTQPLQEIEEGSSGDQQRQQQQTSVVAQLQQHLHQQQQQQQISVAAQLQQQLQQHQQEEQQQRVRFILQQGSSHQQQQQQQPLLRQRSLSQPSLSQIRDVEDSSNSSSGMEPDSGSSSGSSSVAHSGSAAALAAVMSLKAELAKRAALQRLSIGEAPAAAAAAGARFAVPVATASAVAPMQDGHIGPLQRPAGFAAVGQAADAARLLQQQQQHQHQPYTPQQQQQQQQPHPLHVFSSPLNAGPQTSNFAAARRSLQIGGVSAGGATPFAPAATAAFGHTGAAAAPGVGSATSAGAAAAGRYSLDSRAKSAGVGGFAHEHHRPAPRAVASARGGFVGMNRTSGAATGLAAAAANAASGSASSTSASPIPKPRFSLHRAVRKAISARELGSSAAAAGPFVAGSKMLSDPTSSVILSGPGGIAVQEETLQQRLQQQNPEQLQLQHVQWLEQAASGGSSGPPPALAALAADQLQLLAQIADAAKAQVSLPFPQRARSGGPGSSNSRSQGGYPVQPPTHPLSCSTGQFTSAAVAAAAAGTSLTGQFAGLTSASISDPSPQHIPAQQIPPPRHWGGYLPIGPGPGQNSTAERSSLEHGAVIGHHAAAAAAPGSRHSLDTRKGPPYSSSATPAAAAGAGGGVAGQVVSLSGQQQQGVNPNTSVLRYSLPQRPLGEQFKQHWYQQFSTLSSPQGFAAADRDGLGYSRPSSGLKTRRASAPLQHPLMAQAHMPPVQRERRNSALSSIADVSFVTSDSGAGLGRSRSSVGLGRSRRASAPLSNV